MQFRLFYILFALLFCSDGLFAQPEKNKLNNTRLISIAPGFKYFDWSTAGRCHGPQICLISVFVLGRIQLAVLDIVVNETARIERRDPSPAERRDLLAAIDIAVPVAIDPDFETGVGLSIPRAEVTLLDLGIENGRRSVSHTM